MLSSNTLNIPYFNEVPMNISSVLDNGANFAASAYANIKVAAIWSGHAIQVGFNNYLIPASQKLYALATLTFGVLGAFAATSPGIALSVAVGLFVLGFGAFTIADLEATKENCLAGIMWKTVGVAAFIYGTAMTGGCIAAAMA